MADATVISILGRVTFGETFGHLFEDKEDLLNYCDTTFSVNKIENSLKKSDSVYWLALIDRLPVGYAKLKLHSPSGFIIKEESVCQLQKIYVLRDFLSKKVGFQLQEALLKKASNLDFGAIWLSVLDRNTRAIEFYKKNGFKLVGQHDFNIGKEHFEFKVMAKKL